MTKNSKYAEKLRDPRWQKKRLEIFDRDDWTCQMCGDGGSTLHVHHRVYEKGKEPWEYDNSSLVTLCECCHTFETENIADALASVQHTLKTEYFSPDIKSIAKALSSTLLGFDSNVQSHILEWALHDRDTCKYLEEAYFDNLKKEQEEKQNGRG